MANPNIYHAIVFDLHPKVREFLDDLDRKGQIDQDETKAPHVVSVDSPNASVYRCNFMRNGQSESFVIHTRRKAEPVRSWQPDDGWRRVVRVEEPEPDGKRKERPRRSLEQTFEAIMKQILPRRR
jgi:hypothetical protein